MNEVSLLAQNHADASVSAMKSMALEIEIRNLAINYVKTVSMECYLQE